MCCTWLVPLHCIHTPRRRQRSAVPLSTSHIPPVGPSTSQPVHAQRSKGLRGGGASPLLLPGGPWRRGGGGPGGAACSLLEDAQPLPGSSELEDFVPSREVLERSEFLLPLDPETSSMYRRLLQA